MQLLALFLGTLTASVLALPAEAESKKCLKVGATCNGFAGPIFGTCCPGTYCFQKQPDLFVCTPKKEEPVCLRQGVFCRGIAGPVAKPCCKGLTCVDKFPDYGICQPNTTPYAA